MILSEDEKPAELKRGRKKTIYGWSIGLILLALLGSFIGVSLANNVSRAVKVPTETARAFNQPIYLPKTLPGNYKIMEDSFELHEDVLVFNAKDGADGTIAFTEQKKPIGVNFDEFYSTQLKDTKTLSDVPFPSVVGKGINNNNVVLSIVTDDIWIIVSSKAPLSPDDLKIIAKTIKRYQE
jgi:hypothetical protein